MIEVVKKFMMKLGVREDETPGEGGGWIYPQTIRFWIPNCISLVLYTCELASFPFLILFELNPSF